jgi:site-specific DNA-methyltransferase (adenine-specific)
MKNMNERYLDTIKLGDCRDHLHLLADESIELFLSDIPYGIGLDDWDVLHNNTNSALLGQSPAQIGKSGFKRRGKPINGWSQADRNIGAEYQQWCQNWAEMVLPKMKDGASLFVFGARRTMHRVVNAFEDSGFLLKDILAWKKPSAHHRAQRLSLVFERRGLRAEAVSWEGWRLGNLAPAYEPIAWFMKPYRIGGTIADNVLAHDVGAMNLLDCQIGGADPTNILEFGFRNNEVRVHEAQKPLSLIEFLIKLTTKRGHTVLDPFMGSGTTALAAKNLGRHFIGFEMVPEFYEAALQRLGTYYGLGSTEGTAHLQPLLMENPQTEYDTDSEQGYKPTSAAS